MDAAQPDTSDARRLRRAAVFGDIQGHLHAFERSLLALGLSPASGPVHSGDGPVTDLCVIQVGDLIHKGPDSDAVIEMVDRFVTADDGRWVQLVGNHEGQYVGGPMFWGDVIGDDAQRTLAGWYVDRRLAIAAAVTDIAGEQWLISHGGLTLDKWRLIGEPASAATAAALLNNEFHTAPAVALRPGIMLQGETGPPGAAWAEPSRELYGPWLRHGSAPFNQIHGHASPWSFSAGRWWGGTPRAVRKAMEIDQQARHSLLPVGDHRFVGVDTANGPADGDRPIVPWMLDLA